MQEETQQLRSDFHKKSLSVKQTQVSEKGSPPKEKNFWGGGGGGRIINVLIKPSDFTDFCCKLLQYTKFQELIPGYVLRISGIIWNY